MTQIATTIEQGKRLLEAGLGSGSADMHYIASAFDFRQGEWIPQESGSKCYLAVGRPSKEMDIPAWSLSKLIDIAGGVVSFDANTSASQIEELVKAIIFLISFGDIDKEYME